MENKHEEDNNKAAHSSGFQIRSLPWKRILITAGAVLAALLLLFLGTVWYLIATAPELDTINVSPNGSATYICDQDGSKLRKLTLATSNRDIVELEEIPKDLQEAVISIEDERFYEHGGIDLRGIARAFINGVTKGTFSEGASTITQQLIKNNVFTEWTQENSFADRFSRKVQEQYLALQLEKKMSKDEILENYLNTINFGAGCYGVQAASRRYFGKDVSELTLSEAAVLAAIPQNPSALNPIKYPGANHTRQKTVLGYMLEQGYITEAEHRLALADDVYSRIIAYDESYEEETAYSWYEDALIDQVIDTLVSEMGYSSDQAYRAVYSGGLRIFSAQDADLQQICDEEFQNPDNFPAGTEFGVDYALSVADENGLVTHYGSDALRSWIRKTVNPHFDLICVSAETAQEYADAFREHILGETIGESDAENTAGSENEANSEKNTQLTVLGERLTLSPQPQASLVLVEQKTGFVRALVGGRGEKTASLTLNRASETLRQPGSTFKILTAYAPALDSCGQTLATTYVNEPYEYANGTPVSNWDVTDYSGTVTIREAITRSINIAAVKCITAITPRVGFDYAEQFGITTLHESYQSDGNLSSDIIQPLALGGITEGVSNLELCQAYAAIANGGLYTQPKFFTKILDRHGDVVIDYSGESADAARSAEQSAASQNLPDAVTASSATAAQQTQKFTYGTFTRVLQESTAFLLTSAMQDVISSPQGTAYGTVRAAGQPVAGKTGTTSNYKDIWFVGYTPYYTCSVWGGYDNNQDLPDGSNYHSYSKTLWSAVMNRIHAELPIAKFTQPDGITAVKLCSDSHLPAVADACPNTYTEYFADGTQPEEACDLHEPVPETEPMVIYQDFLDQILTETETERESERESESETAASESETHTDTESESDTDIGNNLETEPNYGIGSGTAPGYTPETGTSNQNETVPEASSNSSGNKKQPETSSLEDLINRLNGSNGGSSFSLY